MKTYNKIMLYFWLFVGVLILTVVTYKGFSEGFRKWGFYYLFAGLALLMFVVRRWMMKKMERYAQEMAEKDNTGS